MIHKDSGSLSIGTTAPHVWPPASSTVVLTECVNESTVTVTGHADGHLTLDIRRQDGSVLHNEELGCISFAGDGFFYFNVSWGLESDGRAAPTRLRLNNKPLGPFVAEQDPVVVATTNIDRTLSYRHKDARRACRDWIANRKRKFANPTPPRGAARRLKSIDEQADDLRNSIAAIANAIKSLHENNNRWPVNVIAGELRALVGWHADSASEATHKPLLLRMASKDELPLPVYATRLAEPTDPIYKEAIGSFRGVAVTVVKIRPEQELMDFQDWMKGSAPHFVLNPTGDATAVSHSMTAKDMLFETAHTLGSAHYGEDANIIIDAMRSLGSAHLDFHTKVMLGIAETVVVLASWVLRELERKRLIARRPIG